MTSKQFCLKWNNFQNNILHAFESLQTTEDLTDVTLTCDGFNIKAHKFILSACSPYFRAVFKENPCSHPIIILKDVLHIDLIAIINFMYHGEVLVSEEQLGSFLETAKLLQVSGLNQSTTTTSTTINNENLSTAVRKSPRKTKSIDQHYTIIKKSKGCTKTTKLSKNNENFNEVDQQQQQQIDSSDEEQLKQQSDVNENIINPPIVEKNEQSSILEAVLELKEPKIGSILQRSLTSQTIPAKSPSAIQPSVMNLSQSVFITKKPPDSCELEKHVQQRPQIRTTTAPPPSSGSSSPLNFERPTEFLQQTIKIEEDSYDSNDNLQQLQQQQDDGGNRDLQQFKNIEQQPHHSSQCGNCPHCGKIYSNQSALKYHVRLVHSDLTNMYCCHLCPEAFDYREGYKKHMVEVHCVRN